MNLFSAPARRDPSVANRTVPERKVEWLGSPLAGYQYGTYDGKEYAVMRAPADPDAFVPQPGEILVSRRSIEMIDDRSPLETITHHRGWQVESGTYAKLKARKPKPPAEQPMRVWDRLAVLSVMQRREPMRLVGGPPSSAIDRIAAVPVTSEHEATALGSLLERHKGQKGAPKLIEVGGHEPPERSVAGLVAFLERKGIELRLARGRLVVRSRQLIGADVRELIELAQELIVGHLQGKPVMCSDCGEPAVSIAYPDAPMCAVHLEPPR